MFAARAHAPASPQGPVPFRAPAPRNSGGPGPVAAPAPEMERRMEFADVPLSADGSRTAVAGGPGDSGEECGGPSVRGMSASGSGTISFAYTPETADRSTKIVFIQVMRELLDGTPVLPTVLTPSASFMDADTTSDMDHVDGFAGERDPYMNGDDGLDSGDQGDATSTPPKAATAQDGPHFRSNFPAGHNGMQWEFRTAAFSGAGADQGTYYGYTDWVYSRTTTTPESTSITGTRTGDPGSRFRSAVGRFCSNHGFALPTSGGHAGIGALIGLGAGAATGIAIGAFAGPIGALVGGLIGAGVGAIAGAIAGSQVRRS
jgi:hypothetical protein